MSFRQGAVALAGLGLGLGLSACFGPEDLRGATCQSDDWCAGLPCVDGFCGGPGEAFSSGAWDGSCEGCYGSVAILPFEVRGDQTQVIDIPRLPGQVVPLVSVMHYGPVAGDTDLGYDIRWTERANSFEFQVNVYNADEGSVVAGWVGLFGLGPAIRVESVSPKPVALAPGSCERVVEASTSGLSLMTTVTTYKPRPGADLDYWVDAGPNDVEVCRSIGSSESRLEAYGFGIEFPPGPQVENLHFDAAGPALMLPLEKFGKRVALPNLSRYADPGDGDVGWLLRCAEGVGAYAYGCQAMAQNTQKALDDGQIEASGLAIGLEPQ